MPYFNTFYGDNFLTNLLSDITGQSSSYWYQLALPIVGITLNDAQQAILDSWPPAQSLEDAINQLNAIGKAAKESVPAVLPPVTQGTGNDKPFDFSTILPFVAIGGGALLIMLLMKSGKK